MDVNKINEIQINNQTMINQINVNDFTHNYEDFEEYFINLDLNLPDNNRELEMVTKVINSLDNQIKFTGFVKTVTEAEYFKLYNKLIDSLEYLGDLSLSVFAIEDYIEDKYLMVYKSNPDFTKKLWYAHYAKLHHPYTRLKEKCFRLLTSLDKRYVKKFGKLPKFND